MKIPLCLPVAPGLLWPSESTFIATMSFASDKLALLSGDWWGLITLLVLIVAPLVPAILLYKLFEQKTVVSGPFQGLRLDLSGAFAGYFLVLLLCSGLLYGPIERGRELRNDIATLTNQLDDAKDLGTAWTVSGTIRLKDSQNASIQGASVTIFPAPRITRDGVFQIQVVRDKSGTSPRLPPIEISNPGCFPETVHLEPMSAKLGKQYNKTIDKKNRTLTIDDPILLTKDPGP
jgi:hypothetical protein